MRNFVILGASALVLALGVAQASASQNNSVADFRAAPRRNRLTLASCATSAVSRSTRATRRRRYQSEFTPNERSSTHGGN